MNYKIFEATMNEIAPLSLQANYDNAGWIVRMNNEYSSALTALDCTVKVIEEAIEKGCNLVVVHHPLIFKGLKKIIESDPIAKTIHLAIKNDIDVYAAHTNLDSLLSNGVNSMLSEKLNLVNTSILRPEKNTLLKLITFVPQNAEPKLRNALFNAGAGKMGKYNSCSFRMEGIGSFTPEEGTNPFIGNIGNYHEEKEIKLEMILPIWKKNQILNTLQNNHPYEEVAYDLIALENENTTVGAGMIGHLKKEKTLQEFLADVKNSLNLSTVKFTGNPNKLVSKIALCGGAGSFLIADALKEQADVFLSSDLKYHDFFESQDQMSIIDTGHYENEQFTKELLKNIIQEKFPNFAVQIAESNTNPVKYF
jgi:dinuclear metal center YbgI/SA1388 family protein